MPSTRITAACGALALVAMIVGLHQSASADTPAPRFQVDPFWPKPLPHNWLLGQVAGIAVDRRGNIHTAEVNMGQRVQKLRRLDPQYEITP